MRGLCSKRYFSFVAFPLLSNRSCCREGAILPNGEINWECPCLGNLPNGPCGPSFREAFTCWVDNKDDESTFAENCYEKFIAWEGCLGENRDIYRKSDDSHPEDDNVSPDPSSRDSSDPKSLGDVDEPPLAALSDESVTNSSSGDATRAIAAASVPEQQQTLDEGSS